VDSLSGTFERPAADAPLTPFLASIADQVDDLEGIHPVLTRIALDLEALATEAHDADKRTDLIHALGGDGPEGTNLIGLLQTVIDQLATTGTD